MMTGEPVLAWRLLAVGVWLRTTAAVVAGPRALLLDEFRQQLHQAWKPEANGACDAAFDLMQDYIIRTRDSLKAGAAFLRAPAGVSSPEQCLRACCNVPDCTAAVVERAPTAAVPVPGWSRGVKPRAQNSAALSCYLFNCTYRGRDVCRFSPHRGYSSFSQPLNYSRVQEPRRYGNDEAPHCDAGQDMILLLPTDWVLLDGRGSADDRGIVRYEWTLLQGDPLVNMKSPQPGMLNLSGLREGVYVVQLSVTDTIGQKSNDNVTVTVMPAKQQTTDCTGTCSRYQFICDDGCCIDITLACDGIAQCPDKSDETFCQSFNVGRKTVTHTTLAATSEQGDAMWPFLENMRKDSVKSQKPVAPLESEVMQSPNAEGRGNPIAGRISEKNPQETSSSSAKTSNDDVLISHTKGGHLLPESGAVLPLALGLAITALLLLMIICRLQLVTRRLKKVRPITSEESDYLINGMYL